MKLLAFPKVSENPYQELLYASMRAQGVEVGYLNSWTASATLNLPTWIPRLWWYRLRGYDVFHLHWTDALALHSAPWRTRLGKRLLFVHYILFLKTLKAAGYTVVWTAHNVLPHEPVFLDPVAARKKLVDAADLVIVHAAGTLEALRAIGCAPRRSAVIPHGSYVGVYPDAASRAEAREKLCIAQDAFVYLYLGQIREYKGVDDLLEAYQACAEKNTMLVIAGACREPRLRALLHSQQGERIRWYDGMARNEDLQYYFSAADVAVLPFKEITTSGSMLLALSFGKAIIAPRLGDMAQLPEAMAYVYAPATAEALREAMERAYQNKTELDRKCVAAKQYAAALAWPAIAAQTIEAIQSLARAEEK